MLPSPATLASPIQPRRSGETGRPPRPDLDEPRAARDGSLVPMRAGECTYENDTDRLVSFGQSTLDEMCFAGLTRYPAQPGSSFLRTD